MRRFAAAALALLTVAVLAMACRQYLPTNRYLQLRGEPRSPKAAANVRGRFDHAVHDAALGSIDATCVDCHRFDLLIDAADDAHARELAGRALFGGTGSCHYCHVHAESRQAAAPTTCYTCHSDLGPLRPEDHDLSWQRVHATKAQTDPVSCETCHRQPECIRCHQSRNTIETRVHERNFRFFHGAQARANPMQCGTCHRVDFCIRCHQKGELNEGG
jgi:hypothetical protein